MTDHPLTGARAKLCRARKHIDTFGSVPLGDPNTDTAVIEEHGDWEVSLVAKLAPTDAIPLALVAGDVVQNLRAALDYIAWEIVDSVKGKPGTHTQFPLSTDKNDFDTRVRQRTNTPKDKGPLYGLSPTSPQFATFERHQPYTAGDDEVLPGITKAMTHRLAVLNRLSNRDKHRTLYTYFAVLNDETIRDVLTWEPEAQLVAESYPGLGQAIEHDTELATLRFDPAAAKPYVQVKGRLTLTPILGDKNRAVGFGVFSELADKVAEVITDFERFFPSV